jgi:undecaprenyl-diphosphatase
VRLTRVAIDSTSGGIDYAVFRAINGLAGKSRALDVAMIASAKYLPAVFAIALVLLWISWKPLNQRAAFLAGVSAMIALGLGQIIGKLLPRPRPYVNHSIQQLIPRSLDTSFPSDHAILGFAVAVVIVRHNKRAGMVLLLLAAIMAVSRVFVGAHYPGDVFGGAVLGSMTGAALDKLVQSPPLENLFDRLFVALGRWRVAASETR